MSVVDVSFISLKLVLPVIKTLLKPTGQVLCLIKPQFEAGKEKVGKKGVVREKSTHKEVLDNFVALADELQFKILGLTFSPVKGPEGNIEFLGHLTLDNVAGIRPDTALVTELAHQTLDKGKIHEKCHSDPNPYRDRNFQTVRSAIQILKDAGIQPKLCLPFEVDRNYELPKDLRFSRLTENCPMPSW